MASGIISERVIFYFIMFCNSVSFCMNLGKCRLFYRTIPRSCLHRYLPKCIRRHVY